MEPAETLELDHALFAGGDAAPVDDGDLLDEDLVLDKDLVLDELLVEEISIDGMCGVY